MAASAATTTCFARSVSLPGRISNRSSFQKPTTRFLSGQSTAHGKSLRQFKKTLCHARADGDHSARDNINGVARSEAPPVTKRDFLAGTAAAAAAVTLTPWGEALAEGANFAVDEVTGKPIAVGDLLQKAASVDRILVRGLDNNPTYLLVDGGKVADYALRAVCTHMGCTPDWVGADGKFECPCHGSQYNARGEVVEGPAPENLALVHVKIDDGKVRLDDWNEADFRNGETDPWWI